MADSSSPVSGVWIKLVPGANSTQGSVNIALKYFGFNTKIHYLTFSLFFSMIWIIQFGGELMKKIYA